MTRTTIELETDNGLLWIRLNRPDRLNAFTVAMADELEEAFEAASLDDAVSVVVVTGNGRAFCAGMDLSGEGNVFGLDDRLEPTMADMRDRLHEPEIHNGVRDTGGRVTLAIHRCRKPVIAAINGAAVGIGITMTLAMDFRLASREARIGFVFSKLGIVPEACSTWLLPRLVSSQQALEWVYTGEVFPATDGLKSGLLRSLHEPDQLLEDAEAFARSLVKDRSPVAIALTRHMMRNNAALETPLDAHRLESLAMLYASRGDGKEGVQAFIEKRSPRFAGKASHLPGIFDDL